MKQAPKKFPSITGRIGVSCKHPVPLVVSTQRALQGGDFTWVLWVCLYTEGEITSTVFCKTWFLPSEDVLTEDKTDFCIV